MAPVILASREQIIRPASRGLTNRAIADEVGWSKSTVSVVLMAGRTAEATTATASRQLWLNKRLRRQQQQHPASCGSTNARGTGRRRRGGQPINCRWPRTRRRRDQPFGCLECRGPSTAQDPPMFRGPAEAMRMSSLIELLTSPRAFQRASQSEPLRHCPRCLRLRPCCWNHSRRCMGFLYFMHIRSCNRALRIASRYHSRTISAVAVGVLFNSVRHHAVVHSGLQFLSDEQTPRRRLSANVRFPCAAQSPFRGDGRRHNRGSPPPGPLRLWLLHRHGAERWKVGQKGVEVEI